ncbi:MAG: hypothetical protein KGS45_09965 [Planctomycetes bacterium]|nr:hypothetical protein [Planctomycetota bacterium]
MKNVLIAAAGLVLASSALAQSGSGGTVTQGFSSFTLGDVGTGASDQPLADFSVGGSGNPDHLFQNWWWFRVQGDANETAFNNASNWSYTGNTARLEFSTASFDAVIQYTVTSIRNGLGVLTTTCTVFNTSADPLTLNLFNYNDLDMNETASNDSADLNGVNIIRVTDGGNTGWRANYEGTDAYQVASFSGIRNILNDPNADDLNNTGLPFGPGDWTGAFQWSFSLGSLSAATASATITIIPTPGALALAGVGGLLAARRRR